MLFRSPVWGEGRVLEFSAQLLNTFNHPSYAIGAGSVLGLTTPALTNTGYVTPGNANFLRNNTFSGGLGAAPFQRVIQLNLKLLF